MLAVLYFYAKIQCLLSGLYFKEGQVIIRFCFIINLSCIYHFTSVLTYKCNILQNITVLYIIVE